MSKTLLAAALLMLPLAARAQGTPCPLERVTAQAPAKDGKEPALTVYAYWPGGFSITRRDGTLAHDEYTIESAQYRRAFEARKRAGEKPLPPAAMLLKGPHFVLNPGERATVQWPHFLCSYLAKAESAGLVLELKTSYCQHGQCDVATKLITPELEP